MPQFRFFARSTVAAAVLAGAGMAAAQAPVERPATHTVKAGDTLWDLAQTYLGDPFQWPQIYQLNKENIKDPHWIYPGQVFALPGGTAVDAGAATGAARLPGAERRAAMTVFNPASRRVPTSNRESLIAANLRTAVRAGDFLASPFIWSLGGPTDGGKLDGTAETIGMALTASLRPMQYREEVLVRMPRGVEATAGTHILTYRLAEVIAGQGQVVVPTGVVRLTGAVTSGRGIGVLTQKFEDVFAGQGATLLDTLQMPVGVVPTRVEFGISTRVVWVQHQSALASQGHHLIFAATAAQGLVAGDQLSLRAMRAGDVAETAPDAEIAVAQVTRVTPWGVSAVIIDVRETGIVPGTRAQVSAKMP